jgi:hypothetical protein
MPSTAELRSIYSGPIRRALERLQQQVDNGGQGEQGPPGPPGPPGVVQAIVAGANVTVDSTDPANPIVSSTGGGTGTDEVWISPSAPSDPNIELWYDSDAVATDPTLGFSFVQGSAAAQWVIDHPLSFQPNVTVTDSAGDQVEGSVVYSSPSRVTVSFSAPFAGTAYLS